MWGERGRRRVQGKTSVFALSNRNGGGAICSDGKTEREQFEAGHGGDGEGSILNLS